MTNVINVLIALSISIMSGSITYYVVNIVAFEIGEFQIKIGSIIVAVITFALTLAMRLSIDSSTSIHDNNYIERKNKVLNKR